jgi:GT2 family glycosyltransferase
MGGSIVITPDTRPHVTVVMPIRNEGPFIARSLQSIFSQDYPADRLDILIADGMSTDGTRAFVAEMAVQHPNLRLVDNPGGIVSTGLNAVLTMATGSIIVRVDGHCEIDRSYVSRCVAHLRDEQVAAVGGPLRTVGDGPVSEAIATAMSSAFGVGDSRFRIGSEKPMLVDTVAFPAYLRTAIEQAGPFDEELVRNQDDEYSYRLRAMGFSILLAPDVQSLYYSRASLKKLWSQYYQYGYWKVRVMQKHPRQMRLRQFVPPLFVASLVIGAVAALTLPYGGLLLGAVLIPYVVANAVASVRGARGRWKLLPLLPITFVILHLSYGFGFLYGLFKFSRRWRDRGVRARSMAPTGSEAC